MAYVCRGLYYILVSATRRKRDIKLLPPLPAIMGIIQSSQANLIGTMFYNRSSPWSARGGSRHAAFVGNWLLIAGVYLFILFIYFYFVLFILTSITVPLRILRFLRSMGNPFLSISLIIGGDKPFKDL